MKSKIYFDFSKENSKVDPKFKAGDPIKISKYKNIFCKSLNSKLEFRKFCD